MLGEFVLGVGVFFWIAVFIALALVLPVVLNLRRYKYENISSYVLLAWFRISFTILGAGLASFALVESKGSWLGWAVYVNSIGLLGYQMLRDSAADFRDLGKRQPKRAH